MIRDTTVLTNELQATNSDKQQPATVQFVHSYWLSKLNVKYHKEEVQNPNGNKVKQHADRPVVFQECSFQFSCHSKL